jgi:hypothetical protein
MEDISNRFYMNILMPLILQNSNSKIAQRWLLISPRTTSLASFAELLAVEASGLKIYSPRPLPALKSCDGMHPRLDGT